MKEKNIKKNYEAIIYIIILLVILSCVFAFIRFRANFTEKYLIDYKYVFFDEGTANIINLKTGNTTSVEIEQFCKQEQQSVIWLQTTDRRYGDEERKVKEVCLTNESGETEVIFDTELLWDKAGVNHIYDIAYTENGRVMFISSGDEKILFEYKNGEFIKLSDIDNLWFHFSVIDDELICGTWDDELWSLNIYDDTPLEYIGKGRCVVSLNEQEVLYFNVDESVSAKKSLVTGEMIPMDFDPKGGDYIWPREAPNVSEDGKIAIVHYNTDNGIQSDMPAIGIYYVKENKFINIYDYFRWIHLKNPDFDVEWHAKISATLIPAD